MYALMPVVNADLPPGRFVPPLLDSLVTAATRGEDLVAHVRSIVGSFGFDSFEGLKEVWRGNQLGKGAFDRGGRMPRVESNVTLVKGWFDQTLPNFLAQHPGPAVYLHIDSDTFEAALVVDEMPCSPWQSVHTGTSAEPDLKASPCTPPR
jgi:hypothetical protein